MLTVRGSSMRADLSVVFVPRSMYQNRKKDPGQNRGQRDMEEVPQIGSTRKLSSRDRHVILIWLEEGQDCKERSSRESDGKGKERRTEQQGDQAPAFMRSSVNTMRKQRPPRNLHQTLHIAVLYLWQNMLIPTSTRQGDSDHMKGDDKAAT